MNKKITAIMSMGVLMCSLIGCNNSNVDTNSYLYIGETMISENNLKKFEGYNISYDYESNSLYLNAGYITSKQLGYRRVDNVYLGGDSDNKGNVDYLVTYEGTRDLNIYLYGDFNFNFNSVSQEDYRGVFYFKNDVNVYFKGPGKIISESVNHSLIYGAKAKSNLDNILMDAFIEGGVLFGIASQEVTLANCEINFESLDNEGYSGIYTGKGLVCKRSKINIGNSYYGINSGTSYFYDDSEIVIKETSNIGGRFYAINAYNSAFTIESNGAGLYSYDPGTFYGCDFNINAKLMYAINSTDTTLTFNSCNLNLNVLAGDIMNAWTINFNNSKVIGETKAGFGIYANYNSHVGSAASSLLINNTELDIKSTTGAIWSNGPLFLSDVEISDGGKVLEKAYSSGRVDITVRAICASTETELKLSTDLDKLTRDNAKLPYPTNALNNVRINKTGE